MTTNEIAIMESLVPKEWHADFASLVDEGKLTKGLKAEMEKNPNIGKACEKILEGDQFCRTIVRVAAGLDSGKALADLYG